MLSLLRMYSLSNIEKHPARCVLRKKCSENVQQIYKRTPRPKCDFSKVALLHIFRTPFTTDTSGRLLLKIDAEVYSDPCETF